MHWMYHCAPCGLEQAFSNQSTKCPTWVSPALFWASVFVLKCDSVTDTHYRTDKVARSVNARGGESNGIGILFAAVAVMGQHIPLCPRPHIPYNLIEGQTSCISRSFQLSTYLFSRYWSAPGLVLVSRALLFPNMFLKLRSQAFRSSASVSLAPHVPPKMPMSWARWSLITCIWKKYLKLRKSWPLKRQKEIMLADLHEI